MSSFRNSIGKLFSFTFGLVLTLLLIVSVWLQIDYERYNSDSLGLVDTAVVDGKRHSYMPALLFEFLRATTDWEDKTYTAGVYFRNTYRKKLHRRKDVYFAKCYLTEAEIDSIYNEAQKAIRAK